jgi:hypothetical protein
LLEFSMNFGFGSLYLCFWVSLVHFLC